MGFDLPTEAQWEYAARAGTTTELNSGKNLMCKKNWLGEFPCQNVSEVGRYKDNGGRKGLQVFLWQLRPSLLDTSGGTAKVGSYTVDSVLLVGGSTRIPLIQQELKAVLPVAPLETMHADVAVAMGAAVVAWKADNEPNRSVLAMAPIPVISWLESLENGDYEQIRCHVSQGVDVNEPFENVHGWTPLHVAAVFGYEMVAMALLDAGAAIEAKDQWDYTPLHWASKGGHVATMKVLLAAGASIEAKGKDGGTPLCLAQNKGYATVEKALLAAGAMIEPKNKVAEIADYLVVDLSSGPIAKSYPVSYLKSVPAGGWSDEFKATKMVFRRIPDGTFIMGSPTDELGRSDDETPHQVNLTQPFYIGVFTVTQKQWERVMGTWPSYFNNVSYRDSRPVESVSYNDIRGSNFGAGWPANGEVDADSFMGQLRARTGKVFDLPTEAQWEYAGRAGTTTALNSCKNLTPAISCPNMSEVGRYSENGCSIYLTPQRGDTSKGTANVGSYLPNAWGLYDIHGNVWEWCLDWFGPYPGTGSDPGGAISGWHRVARGGGWHYYASFCRVGARSGNDPDDDYANGNIGFRVALPPTRADAP